MNESQNQIFEQIQQLCAMFHRAAFYEHHPHGRNPHRGQGRVLAILKLKPEISQKQLTYLLGTSRQSLAELLKKLEDNGLITREPSPDDPRAKIVKLTQPGALAAEQLETEQIDNDDLFACLSEEEQTTLSQLLDRLIQNLETRFPDIDFDERRRMMQQFHAQHGEPANHPPFHHPWHDARHASRHDQDKHNEE